MFNVAKCIYQKSDGGAVEGWVIEHPSEYPYWVNKYLHQKCMGSSQTAKQYAYKLCKYLNYLAGYCRKRYDEATLRDLLNFLRYLQFGNIIPVGIVIEGQRSGHTIRSYCTVITGFYSFLNCQGRQTQMELPEEPLREDVHSYLYGQNLITAAPRHIVESSYSGGKPPIEYEKWYSDEQVDAIIQNLRTYRDKALFSLSLDGLRIDEILSAQMHLYQSSEGTLKLKRSKGRSEEGARLCVLSERSRRLLEEYLYNERCYVEQKLLDENKAVPTEIFVNLREREDSFGMPMKYHNALEIIKRAAQKAGMDPSKIRTHSGRSTKAGELFRQQAVAPESLTDNQILEIMGWRSMESANPYKNRQDRVTAMENWKRLNSAKERRGGADGQDS